MRAILLLSLVSLAEGCSERARTRNSVSASMSDEPATVSVSPRVFRYEAKARTTTPAPEKPEKPEKKEPAPPQPERPRPPLEAKRAVRPPVRPAVVIAAAPTGESPATRKDDVLAPPAADAPQAPPAPPAAAIVAATATPPPVPQATPRAGFKTIAAAELETYRLSGRRIPELPAAAAVSAEREHLRTITVGIALCVAPDGLPVTVDLTAPSGNRDADSHIVAEVARWRFTPYLIGGRPIRVCTRLSFNYQVN